MFNHIIVSEKNRISARVKSTTQWGWVISVEFYDNNTCKIVNR